MARSLMVLVGLVGLASSETLPPNIKTCKSSDPTFNDCLKGAIADAIPTLVKGIPSLGVMPLDPLEITHLHIGKGDGPVKITLDFNNVKLSGLGALQLKSVNMDTKNYKLSSEVFLPEPITLSGPYKVDGQVLVLPIKGEGNCNLTFTQVPVHTVLHGEPINKNGETYMDVKEFEMTMEPNHFFIQFDNLFNGDKNLGDNMNTFLDENWKNILAELKPAIESALGASFKEIANRVFHKVPFNQVFPEN